jgi:hypothetical protein
VAYYQALGKPLDKPRQHFLYTSAE